MADPRAALAQSTMAPAQIAVVALCVMLNALDGFDVLSISFASPGIATEWGINRAALGAVLSMELIGMAVGSIALGNLADRWGRRPIVFACLLLMVVGMAASTQVQSVVELSATRLFTGVGIGGMLAATNAVVSEFSNAKRHDMSVALMAAGYPLGAAFGGLFASHLLAVGDWRLVFWFGAGATALMIPLVVWLLPETPSYLLSRGPAALDRLNRLLVRLRQPRLSEWPTALPQSPRPRFAELFAPHLSRTTILLTAAYFAHIMTFYFILKWIPKIVTDLGYSPSSAGGVLVWASCGGAAGALMLSILTQKLSARMLVLGALALSVVMVVAFGFGQSSLSQISLMAALTGFCTNGAVVGLYAMFARAFPGTLRATGTGLVIGVGRGGAALGPILAGLLFVAGAGLLGVALAMAVGSLLAAIAIAFLRSDLGAKGPPGKAPMRGQVKGAGS